MKPHILSDTEFAALAARLRSDLAHVTGLAIEARAHVATLAELLLDATAVLASVDTPEARAVLERIGAQGGG